MTSIAHPESEAWEEMVEQSRKILEGDTSQPLTEEQARAIIYMRDECRMWVNETHRCERALANAGIKMPSFYEQYEEALRRADELIGADKDI
jgi:hypothetical protein